MRLVLTLALAALFIIGLARFGTTSGADGEVLELSPTGRNAVAGARLASETRPLQPTGLSGGERTDLSTAVLDTVDESALETPSAIRGRVVDRWGRPVAGASVELVGAEESVTSDANGQFALTPCEGTPTTVIAWHAALGSGVRDTVHPGQPAELGDIRLSERGVLAGRIVTPDDRPARFLRLYARSYRLRSPGQIFNRFMGRERQGLLEQVGETDEAGRFRFVGLAPGEYWLELGADGENGFPDLSPEGVESLEHFFTGDVAIHGVYQTPRILAWIDGGEGEGRCGLLVGGQDGLSPKLITADARGLAQPVAEQGRVYSLRAHRITVRGPAGNRMSARIEIHVDPAGSGALFRPFPTGRFELEVHLTLPPRETPQVEPVADPSVSHM